jgi:asparaginyl-tRNA synthetase
LPSINILNDKGFVYLHTPLIRLPTVKGPVPFFRYHPGSEESAQLPNGNIDYFQDFFGRQNSLTVSGQLEENWVPWPLENIHFGPTFRAENSIPPPSG